MPSKKCGDVIRLEIERPAKKMIDFTENQMICILPNWDFRYVGILPIWGFRLKIERPPSFRLLFHASQRIRPVYMFRVDALLVDVFMMTPD